ATDGSTTEGSGTGDETPALTPEAICTMICEYHFGSAYACSAEMLPDKVVVRCEVEGSCVVDGRRHAWVVSRVAVDGVDATSWLLRAAHDEAASVHAFRALAGELAAYGAPRELLARIEAAAGDEVRHAAAVTMLARARGVAEVPAPEVATAPIRSLLAIALENAIEGCVHETWAALRAAHQARCAADPVVRRIYASIAADEARHAELAWAIDAWLSRQLDAAGRAEVEAARKAAARALAARLATGDIGPELIALGLPPPHVAARLCVGLNAALWSRAA
ncbi:MAG TPA: ferritin-like domain-containing protein, partial [Nannocystis sp.]